MDMRRRVLFVLCKLFLCSAIIYLAYTRFMKCSKGIANRYRPSVARSEKDAETRKSV